MTAPSTEFLDAIIAASPAATIIVDRHGSLRADNQAARHLLNLSVLPESLYDVFSAKNDLREMVRRALRLSFSLPASIEYGKAKQKLRLDMRALVTDAGTRPEHLLITIQAQRNANKNMIALKQRLDDVSRERTKLKDENHRLTITIDTKIPELEALSYRDGLTGLYNRRYFDKQMRREWHRAQRNGGEVSLISIDIDLFKDYNDTLGHPQGDICLKQFATALVSGVTREFDAVCRVGGEEFSLILPMTDGAGAVVAATQLQTAIHREAIPHPTTAAGFITASIGVGTVRPAVGVSSRTLVEQSDAELYRAKAAGRNCIAILDGAIVPPSGVNRPASRPTAAVTVSTSTNTGV